MNRKHLIIFTAKILHVRHGSKLGKIKVTGVLIEGVPDIKSGSHTQGYLLSQRRHLLGGVCTKQRKMIWYFV